MKQYEYVNYKMIIKRKSNKERDEYFGKSRVKLCEFIPEEREGIYPLIYYEKEQTGKVNYYNYVSGRVSLSVS